MIKKRKENTWWIRIYLGRGPDGKKEFYNETFYAPIKSLAQERERELKKKLKGQPIGPHTNIMTLGQWLDAWMIDIKDSVTTRTYSTYKYNAKRIKPFIKDLNLWTLNSEQLTDVLRGQFENMRPRSKKNMYSFVHTVVQAAIDAKRAPQDALQGFRIPRVPKVHRDTLDREEMQMLVMASDPLRYGLVIRLLILTGARISEILGLTWDAIDFEQGYITINKSINIRTKELNDRPKTENSRRSIVLDQETIDLLKLQQEKQKTELRTLDVVPLSVDKGLVFLTSNGKPVDYSTIWQTLATSLKRAGLAHMRIHDIRHSVITLLLTEGISLVKVASLAGQDVNTTTGQYTHLLKKAVAISLNND